MTKTITLLLFVFSLTACGGESTIKKQTKKQPPAEKTANKKTDERGFDPCLLNANLAVCKNNETVNSK